MELQKFYYDNKIVKQFILATLVWGVVALIVGLLAALQLAWPIFNFDLEHITYGHTRPLHTNAVIFAFIGNAIFAGVYYSMQKLLKTRMASDFLSKLNFWGWQFIIVCAAITFLFGYTTGKEYAELEWPIDILIAIVWVAFGLNMILTIVKRRVKHIYAAIWWYIATFVGVAILHIVNSFEIPVTFLKSYPVFAGAQDAVVQWWYGHNAVAFFLTTPFLGLMYYYLPKAANRPIYSYKLSIIHFWSLIFLYMWAGPHHLLYQALPDWAQALGVTFSIMLIAPSWGGMINGLMTLRGVWDKVRDSAVLKFFVVGVTAYGLSTFEGPMMSLKNVNAISHFTDWTVAHTHIGGMAWNGGITFGMLYWLIPKIFKTKIFSNKLANTHFWISTLGVLIYAIPLYWGAITQWLMWREYTPEGLLQYPNFLETVTQLIPMYMLRALGGTLYLIGFVIMVYNMLKTIKIGSFIANEESEAPAVNLAYARDPQKESPHRFLERKGIRFTLIALVALAIGGAVEIIPMTFIKSNVPEIESVKPYTPLELEGRDIYVSNGCYTCHSQMVRPFRWETDRYGEYSKIGEFVYDHPFQWGSRRTGPDLARAGVVGGPMYKNAAWHFNHFMDPQKMNEQSIMPAYPWFATKKVKLDILPKKIRAMMTLGVPYEEGYDQKALDDYMEQAQIIYDDLINSNINPYIIDENDPENPDDNDTIGVLSLESEMIAMIAYLHKMGKDISPIFEEEENEAAREREDIVLIDETEENLSEGKTIFNSVCSVCHGENGEGVATFPNLIDDEWIHGNTPTDIFYVIKEGKPLKGMIPYGNQYTDEQINQITLYVLKGLKTNE
jgi:cytochrome c oxidase cbb3-type subunit I/II